jgi:hypothetical protein
MTHCHFAHQKSHIQYSGFEQGYPWREMTNSMGYKHGLCDKERDWTECSKKVNLESNILVIDRGCIRKMENELHKEEFHNFYS